MNIDDSIGPNESRISIRFLGLNKRDVHQPFNRRACLLPLLSEWRNEDALVDSDRYRLIYFSASPCSFDSFSAEITKLRDCIILTGVECRSTSLYPPGHTAST